MTGPITSFFRKRDIRKNGSARACGLVSLERAKEAVLFINGTEPSATELIDEVKAYFRTKEIKVHVYALNFERGQLFAEGGIDAGFIHKNNVNWYGRIKSGSGSPVVVKDCDIFISLVPLHHYLIEREALCSNAVLKVGRYVAPCFNMVMEDRPEQPFSQEEAFVALRNLLEKIA